MKSMLLIAALWVARTVLAAAEPERPSVILVVGAGGEEKYADLFSKWAANWRTAAEEGAVKLETVGIGEDADGDRARLKFFIESEPADSPHELWIVLLGHGTSDSREPKFNLRKDDIGVSEFADWLRRFKRTTVVVCGFSASGAWLKPLAASERIVITATRSGSENNFARLGGYLAQSIAEREADVDKDGETSLLEAWLVASRKVSDFYKEEGRIATEHSLLDDNGDGLGTPADWFRGVRAVKRAKDGAAPDGIRAQQIRLVRSSEERALPPELRRERDALERELAALRDRKEAMKEGDYFRELENVLLKLARIYKGRQ